MKKLFAILLAVAAITAFAKPNPPRGGHGPGPGGHSGPHRVERHAPPPRYHGPHYNRVDRFIDRTGRVIWSLSVIDSILNPLYVQPVEVEIQPTPPVVVAPAPVVVTPPPPPRPIYIAPPPPPMPVRPLYPPMHHGPHGPPRHHRH